MKMKEMIEAVRNVQDYEVKIIEKLNEIVKNTYDPKCYCIDFFDIGDKYIGVGYLYSCRGESDRDHVNIPKDWLDEKFDYKSAFEEEKRKIEETRRIKEAEEKKRLEAKRKADEIRKAKAEYEQYLKLKAKYEKTN